jgi:Uma2 family endonuclease
MIVATQKLTFDEYLVYEDGTDTRYELVKGELVPMSLGTGKHAKLAKLVDDRLTAEIERLALAWTSQRFTVGIQSPRGYRWDTCRIPDVTVLSRSQWDGMEDREAVIRAHETPPLLVVEVVSPSTGSDDYRAKWVEYAALDIGEYWIVDPLESKVTVCLLEAGRYQDRVFVGFDRVLSSLFPELDWLAEQILAG